MREVLVTYASKHGATAEIADAIAEKLREFGLAVTCTPVDEVSTLEPYDAVILGSAVYVNRWRRDARRFLRRHAGELSRLPFWAFSSGPVAAPGRDGLAVGPEPDHIRDKVESLGCRGHVVFEGRLPTEPRGPLELAVVKRTPRPYRDRRRWGEIREWASLIAADLTDARERHLTVAPPISRRPQSRSGCNPMRQTGPDGYFPAHERGPESPQAG